MSQSHPHGAEAAFPSDQDMSRSCWGLEDLRRESEQRRACLWRSQCPPNLSLCSHAGGLPRRSQPSGGGWWQSAQPDDTGSKVPALQWGTFPANAAVSIWFSGHCKSGRAEAMAGGYVSPSKEESSLFGCFTANDTMILVTRVRATN